MVAFSREARKDMDATIAAYATMHKDNSGSSHGSSLLVDLLACQPGDGYRQDHPRDAEGWRLQHEAETPWKTDGWTVERRCLGTWVREASKKMVPATTSELNSCLQTCGQDGCSTCNPTPTMTCTAGTCNLQSTRCVVHKTGRY